MHANDLPLVNACLNGLTTILLLGGFAAVKTGHKGLHQKLMVAAFCTSSLFLACYLAHKVIVHKISYFPDLGWIRTFYLILLLSHTILAAVNLPLIIRTIYLAATGRFDEHRRLARWTFPVWMYVSVTGVLVYLMLYQWFKTA